MVPVPAMEAIAMPHRVVPPALRANARRMRREMTDAEARLWSCLRGHRFCAVSFRRQVPVGPFVVDFLCASAKLVIEVDGGQHGEAAGLRHDARRDAWLAEAGYTVLRFWNHDVLAETPSVLERIFSELVAAGAISGDAAAPLPVPPPRGGRERAGHRSSYRERGLAATPSPDDLSTVAVTVPSPLEGEGQGGGAKASPRSIAPKIGPIP